MAVLYYAPSIRRPHQYLREKLPAFNWQPIPPNSQYPNSGFRGWAWDGSSLVSIYPMTAKDSFRGWGWNPSKVQGLDSYVIVELYHGRADPQWRQVIEGSWDIRKVASFIHFVYSKNNFTRKHLASAKVHQFAEYLDQNKLKEYANLNSNQQPDMKTPVWKIERRLYEDGLRVTHLATCDGCRQYTYMKYRFLENISGVYVVKVT